MPNQQIESATPTRLHAISTKLLSRKLRVAGRLLHHDTENSTILIHDGEDALLVDVSLCLSPGASSPWLREPGTIVMALGYLELLERSVPLPVLSAHAPDVAVNPRLVLKAIVAQEARDLDMAVWNKAIDAREEVTARETSQQQNEGH
ncbi:hypothetical protein BN946_scf184976.g13 [Trametes cinnabarina]|uniref:Uncharacterized protein n=1 Tax=Pycnoporus cinnabarinus TaxID=5643 RepID=A0A060SAL4_PYCCI|nr:hypothetical protein BN946_scf184976.g13 [Trametes cinnabarina]